VRYLFVLGALALAGCQRSAVPPPRLLHIRAAADAAFRRRPNWQEVIGSRVVAVSRVFERAAAIRCEVSGTVEWSPDPAATVDKKRRELEGTQSDGDSIFVGFTAPPDHADEPGSAVPFDARVLVFDFPEKSEQVNVSNLAHELAHVFGAWHSADAKSLTHLPPGNDFDSNALACLRLTRSVDFRTGIGGLDKGTLDRVVKLWSDSKLEPASNPVYRAWSEMGYELVTRGLAQPAVEPLAKAARLAPGEARIHSALGTTLVVLRRFSEAASEFRTLTEITPQSAGAFNNLAFALLQSQQTEEALAALRKASRIEPANANLHANIGITLSRLPGHLDEAIEELRQAVRINPNDESAKLALNAVLEARSKGRK